MSKKTFTDLEMLDLSKNKYVKKDVYIAYGDIAFNVMFGTNLLGG